MAAKPTVKLRGAFAAQLLNGRLRVFKPVEADPQVEHLLLAGGKQQCVGDVLQLTADLLSVAQALGGGKRNLE